MEIQKRDIEELMGDPKGCFAQQGNTADRYAPADLYVRF
jgi:hypothetical protein